MFLSSAFGRNSCSPGRRTETFASQRSEPFSMSQSETPIAWIVAFSSVRKRRAASGVRRSGSVTISSNGVPQRLKSTTEPVEPAMRPAPPPAWIVLAASSSRWARTKRTVSVPSGPSTSSEPPTQRGSSYCEIWYALGESG